MTRKKKRKDHLNATFTLVVKDGNTPIMKVKEQKLSALDEVIALLRKKL